MKRRQMSRQMLGSTMKWLLGSLGKVQLQFLMCSVKPSSNHVLCRSDWDCTCPDSKMTQSTGVKSGVMQEQRTSAQRS